MKSSDCHTWTYSKPQGQLTCGWFTRIYHQLYGHQITGTIMYSSGIRYEYDTYWYTRHWIEHHRTRKTNRRRSSIWLCSGGICYQLGIEDESLDPKVWVVFLYTCKGHIIFLPDALQLQTLGFQWISCTKIEARNMTISPIQNGNSHAPNHCQS